MWHVLVPAQSKYVSFHLENKICRPLPALYHAGNSFSVRSNEFDFFLSMCYITHYIAQSMYVFTYIFEPYVITEHYFPKPWLL